MSLGTLVLANLIQSQFSKVLSYHHAQMMNFGHFFAQDPMTTVEA